MLKHRRRSTNMKKYTGILVAVFGFSLPAYGLEKETSAPASTDASPRAASGFEILSGAGYSQGFGEISDGRALGDSQSAGTSLEIEVGYRFTPNLSIGSYWAGAF